MSKSQGQPTLLPMSPSDQKELGLAMWRVVIDWARQRDLPGLTGYHFGMAMVKGGSESGVPRVITLSYYDYRRFDEQMLTFRIQFYDDRMELGCVEWPSLQPVTDYQLLAVFLRTVLDATMPE